jgi:hypothetical protein
MPVGCKLMTLLILGTILFTGSRGAAAQQSGSEGSGTAALSTIGTAPTVPHDSAAPAHGETQAHVRKVPIAYLAPRASAPPAHDQSVPAPARGRYSASDAPVEDRADPFRQLELIQHAQPAAADPRITAGYAGDNQ